METRDMITRKLLKLTVVVAGLGIFVEAAVADVLPSGFGFSFFAPGLGSLLALPFRLAGCA